jgi:hypothetical protein
MASGLGRVMMLPVSAAMEVLKLRGASPWHVHAKRHVEVRGTVSLEGRCWGAQQRGDCWRVHACDDPREYASPQTQTTASSASLASHLWH